MSREIPLAFVLATEARSGHPHSEYTHVCDVTLFGREMWSLWGRSAEEAESAAEFEISARVTERLRGFPLRPRRSPSGKERGE